MFDFEFTGTSYGDQINREAAIEAAEAKATELLGDDWKAKSAQIYASFPSDDGPTESELEIWQDIESAATATAFEGWVQIPDNMSLVWR